LLVNNVRNVNTAILNRCHILTHRCSPSIAKLR
jgi:hypothetical protein